MVYKCHLLVLALLAGGCSWAFAGGKIKGDPAKATPIVAEACAACHGQDGNSPVPNFPRLAGQTPEYLFLEMREFKSGRRQSEIMAPFLAPLSETDLANIAVYFSVQKPLPGDVSKPELVAAGKKIYLGGNDASGVPSCDGCHEENGAGSGKFPRVAAQNIEYTLDQLRLYASHARPNAAKAMRIVGERLSAGEAEAVAQFLASMK